MKNDNFIRDAIDESLSSVHFDSQDMRSVLRAARGREQAPVRRRAARRTVRLDFAFAMAMALILVVPIGLFALRAQGLRTTSIVAAPGVHTAGPGATLDPQSAHDPQADLIVASSAPSYSADESEAIRIARACFEETCDTSIFTFEEYAVSVTLEGDAHTVTLESIYGNGCRFVAVVSVPEGRVLRHSTPRLATMPTYLSADAPEIQAWYAKHGPYLFTWPQEAQAEFSRRYEGAALRTARPDELTAEEAASLASKYAAESFGLNGDALPYAYPVLYSERASGDGAASYVVHCFAQPVTDTLPERAFIVTLSAASGELLSVSAN